MCGCSFAKTDISGIDEKNSHSFPSQSKIFATDAVTTTDFNVTKSLHVSGLYMVSSLEFRIMKKNKTKTFIWLSKQTGENFIECSTFMESLDTMKRFQFISIITDA